MSTIYGVDESSTVASVTVADRSSATGAVGEIKLVAGSAVPDHCFECDGSAVSRTAYPELFEAISTTYGTGDGTSTFNLPDFRDYFLRGKGGEYSEELGTEQSDAIRYCRAKVEHIRAIRSLTRDTQLDTGGLSWLYSYTPTDTTLPSSPGYVINTALTEGWYGRSDLIFDTSQFSPTADENRPINYAVTMCIVYE